MVPATAVQQQQQLMVEVVGEQYAAACSPISKMLMPRAGRRVLLLAVRRLLVRDERRLLLRAPRLKAAAARVKHKVMTPYHPRANGQAELANREIKQILEKSVANKKDWAKHLDDALGHIALPTRLLLAYWAMRRINLEFNEVGFTRRDLLTELDEWQNKAYESSRIYKERGKKFHDLSIRTKEFKPGQELFLYDSKLRLFPGKLQFRWRGPYVVHKSNWNETYELLASNGSTFTVNGHRPKPYFKAELDRSGEVVKFIDP
ncbi:uncharacterized protein LOC131025681 [Salvia miltiorrhiza]|uniref:uncharacterized protein LOC131025681 n=1 Tax=Salvia miltiorrhiza TaxID=226208 RepID=UPI0025ACC335|nr:uncharacterized protein LOC131025681 [Salvia miltiorrhiza]